MLCVTSPNEVELSDVEKERIWEIFMRQGTAHSWEASTLPFIIRRCERLGMSYKLIGKPGSYHIERHES